MDGFKYCCLFFFVSAIVVDNVRGDDLTDRLDKLETRYDVVVPVNNLIYFSIPLKTAIIN